MKNYKKSWQRAMLLVKSDIAYFPGFLLHASVPFSKLLLLPQIEDR